LHKSIRTGGAMAGDQNPGASVLAIGPNYKLDSDWAKSAVQLCPSRNKLFPKHPCLKPMLLAYFAGRLRQKGSRLRAIPA
jgi:hypothetical protein